MAVECEHRPIVISGLAPVEALGAGCPAVVLLRQPPAAARAVVPHLAGGDLHRADFAVHVLYCHRIVLKLVAAALESP